MTFGPRRAVLPLDALLAMLAAAATIGQSIILGKRIAADHPAVTNAVGMLTGAALLLTLSALVGEAWVLPRRPEVVWAVVYLVTAGSVGLFVLVLLVVRRWTASATAYMFVLFPIATMALGAALGDEQVTPEAVTGAVLVMLGAWFGALSPGARAGAVVPSPPVSPPVAESPSGV
jgi:drug/metabolite transporter (DMT)-like permease